MVGFDPWLHTAKEIDEITLALAGSGVRRRPVANVLDAVWADQPPPPAGPVAIQPIDLAGEAAAGKRGRLAAGLAERGVSAVILTLPDSISWLLNIRGGNVARNPVVHAFAILHADRTMDLFSDPAKYDDAVRAHLGDAVRWRRARDLRPRWPA